MIDDDTIENASIDGANEYGVEATTKEPMQSDPTDSAPVRVRIPWIGALDNPRLGPMVVVGDGGYLVPLWTAGDLLRGCRYLWRASQE
jgi:hypothetical protein